MEDALAGTAIELIKELIVGIAGIVEAHNNVSDNAKRLVENCKMVEKLLEPFIGADSLPVNGIIDDLSKKIKAGQELVKEYYEINEKCTTTTHFSITKPIIKIKRAYKTADFSQQFNDYVDEMNILLSQLRTALRLTTELLEPSSLLYEKEMEKKECMKFWLEICGNRIHSDKVSWPLFITRYQQKFKQVDLELKTRIKATALVENDVLTLFGFIQLTDLCGLPVNEANLPQILDCNANISASDLIKVSDMVSNLIKDYSTNEMNDYLVAIILWFKGSRENNNNEQVVPNDLNRELTKDEKKEKKKQENQQRADECYTIIKSLRAGNIHKYGYTEEEQKQALFVDESRRHISYFFQRFMAICEIGQLSREIFKKVDFPGKGRMYNFIDYCQPLDKANYHLIIKNGEPVNNWEEKKPKVYKFLESYLKEIDSKKEKKSDATKKKETDVVHYPEVAQR